MTQQEFASDEFDCRSRSRVVSGYGNTVDGTGWMSVQTNVDRNMYKLCMYGKGYSEMSQ